MICNINYDQFDGTDIAFETIRATKLDGMSPNYGNFVILNSETDIGTIYV